MNFRILPFLFAGVCTLPWLPIGATVSAQTSFLTYHADLSSTGQNLTETKLNPSNVNSSTFGKIFSVAVDAQVYAQPLYVPGLTIGTGTYKGTAHNTTFIGTQNDSVYAIDADSGAILWQVSLATNGETSVPNGDTGTTDINPIIGIVSTPVIDSAPDSSGARYIYFVAKTKIVINNVPTYFLRLHALDITTGAERTNSPVVLGETGYPGNSVYNYISGPSVAGTGAGSVNGVVNFNALRENQRPGLSLYNGTLYIACASHGDNGPYHGWVLGYTASSFVQTAAFCATPNGSDGGIWQAGGRVDVDQNGALYFATGNGSFANASTGTDPVPTDFDANGYPANFNYGDSVVKLVVDSSTAANPNSNGWGLKVSDYFTPYNERTLNNGDTDLGSGGVLLLPDSSGSTAHPHLLVASGKEGRIFLIDRDNLGKFLGGITTASGSPAFVSTADAVVQASNANLINGSLSTAGYYNGQFYYAGAYSSDAAKSFTIGNAAYSTTPASKSSDTYGYLGATATISASSATANGVVWLIDRGTNELRAYSAATLANELYNSDQAANNRDLLGTGSKFAVPTVADGHVLVGTSGTAPEFVCFGLLAPATTPPAQPQNLYAQTVSGGEIDLFWEDESNNESGFEIYVSLDPTNFPTTPRVTTGANVTSYAVSGLQINTTYYFEVRAVNDVGPSAFSNTSATTSGAAPPVDFTNGFAGTDAYFTFNGFKTTEAITGSALQITDTIGTYEDRSAWLNTAQAIGSFSCQFTFVDTSADADGMCFVMQSSGLSALGQNGGALGYGGMAGKSVAIKFDIYPSLSTTGLYENGTQPDDATTATSTSSGALDVTGAGVDFHSGHPMRVTLAYDGSNLYETITDTVTRQSFNHIYSVNIASILGSSTMYLGFTGGTGGLYSNQYIQSWSYTNVIPITPLAPSNLVAQAASGTQINLSWQDNSTNETGFRVDRSLGDGSGTFLPIGSVGANVTTYVDANLNTSTEYSYRVSATNQYLTSSASNVVTITTPIPPTRPSGATPTLLAAYEIDFTWMDNSNNEDGFRILRENGGGDYKQIAVVPPNTTSYKDKTVMPDTTYDYHIEAFNAAGYVDFTGFEATTPSAVSVVSTNATIQESVTNPLGSMSIRRTNALTTPLTVGYTIKTGSGQAAYGTRYTLTPAPKTSTSGTVTIPANATSAAVNINPLSDQAILGSQAVTITLNAGAGYSVAGYTNATVTILDTPINAWKVKFAGSVANANTWYAADDSDPDGDGLSNLVEYALGLDPTVPDLSIVPVQAIETIDGVQYLTLTYHRPYTVPLGIITITEASHDLLAHDWTNAIVLPGYPVPDPGGATKTIKVRSPWPMTQYSTQFIRFRAERSSTN